PVRVFACLDDAREMGAVTENAQYHAARERQGFIEGHIQDIEGKLSNAQVIDIKTIPHSGKVLFGTTVRIINSDTEEEVEYKIVGDDEADIKNNRISVSSPIARALIGKEEGDVVMVKIPSGTVEFEIDEVRHL